MKLSQVETFDGPRDHLQRFLGASNENPPYQFFTCSLVWFNVVCILNVTRFKKSIIRMGRFSVQFPQNRKFEIRKARTPGLQGWHLSAHKGHPKSDLADLSNVPLLIMQERLFQKRGSILG